MYALRLRTDAFRTIEFLTAHPPTEEVRLPGQPYEDISAGLGKIAVPTLVLAEDQDRQDPVVQHNVTCFLEFLARKLQIISDCGHLMPIDQPAKLADAIRAFVYA